MTRSFLATVTILLGQQCMAHDFWVQPDEYQINTGKLTPLTLQVGHGPYRQRSPLPLRRIVRFEAIDSNGNTTDLRGRLHPGNDTNDGDLQFDRPGTYMLVLQSDNRAQSHLPALRFNDYLQAEGLTPALQARQIAHRMQADGSECYSRNSKVIIQAGAANNPRAVTTPIGLPLEIVPEKSPYQDTTDLPVRILYLGHPLGGALVKLTQLEHDAEPLETHLTNTDGRVVFNMPHQGTWLVNVIWTQPLPDGRETDFETIFSSLSFGFPTRSGSETR
jgi:uncharacterized GH25 family protein